MREPDGPARTPLSMIAGVVCLLLALVLVSLFGSHDVEAEYLRMLVAALATATLLMGARLGITNCPESRFAASVLALMAVTGTLLSTTAGMPGASPVTLGAQQWSLLALGPAVPLLLGIDARTRRVPGRPYAL